MKQRIQDVKAAEGLTTKSNSVSRSWGEGKKVLEVNMIEIHDVTGWAKVMHFAHC